jgi:hypothetical protein
MRLLDSIVERSIHRTPDGRCVWYPWSFLGAGYIVPSSERRVELLGFQKRWIVAAFAVLLASIPFGAPYRLAAVAVFVILNYAATRRKIDELERSDIPLTVKAVIQRPSVLSLPLLIPAALASIILLACSGLLLITGRDLLGGLIGVLLFGWSTFVLAHDVHSRLASKDAGAV